MTTRMTQRTVPGVGLSRQLDLRDGHRMSVVVRRDGTLDLTADAHAVRLDADEADELATALGSHELVARLQRALTASGALLVEQIPLPAHSPHVRCPLGDTRLRSRTGASVVAVLRGEVTQPSPKPDFVLEADDLVVAVGTREALDQVGRILDGTG